MKGSMSLANSHTFYYSFSFSNANHVKSGFACHVNDTRIRNLGLNLGFHSSPNQLRRDKGSVAARASSWSSVAELEKELEAEMKTHEEETTFKKKCGEERKGVLELLECLEMEAIMGEDVGKEPTDYNRRAQIFDRSSRVFQALKQLNTDDNVLSQQ